MGAGSRVQQGTWEKDGDDEICHDRDSDLSGEWSPGVNPVQTDGIDSETSHDTSVLQGCPGFEAPVSGRTLHL